jgi:hypothetical protein
MTPDETQILLNYIHQYPELTPVFCKLVCNEEIASIEWNILCFHLALTPSSRPALLLAKFVVTVMERNLEAVERGLEAELARRRASGQIGSA